MLITRQCRGISISHELVLSRTSMATSSALPVPGRQCAEASGGVCFEDISPPPPCVLVTSIHVPSSRWLVHSLHRLDASPLCTLIALLISMIISYLLDYLYSTYFLGTTYHLINKHDNILRMYCKPHNTHIGWWRCFIGKDRREVTVIILSEGIFLRGRGLGQTRCSGD